MSSRGLYEVTNHNLICFFCRHQLIYGSNPSAARVAAEGRRRLLHSTPSRGQAGGPAPFSDPELAPAPRPARAPQPAPPPRSSAPRSFRDPEASYSQRPSRDPGLSTSTRAFRDPEVSSSPRSFRDPDFPSFGVPRPQQNRSSRDQRGFQGVRFHDVPGSDVSGSAPRRSDNQNDRPAPLGQGPRLHFTRVDTPERRPASFRDDVDSATDWSGLRRRGEFDQTTSGGPTCSNNGGSTQGDGRSRRMNFQGLNRPRDQQHGFVDLRGQSGGNAQVDDQIGPRELARERARDAHAKYGGRFEPDRQRRSDRFTPLAPGASNAPATSSIFDELPKPTNQTNAKPSVDGDPWAAQPSDSAAVAAATGRDKSARTPAPELVFGRRDRGQQASRFTPTNTSHGRKHEASGAVEAEPIAASNDAFDVDMDEAPARERRSKRLAEKPKADAPKRRLKDDKATRRAEKFAEEEEEDEDYAREQRQLKERERKKQERKEKREAAKQASQTKKIELPPFIGVGNLATLLKVRPEAFGEKLKELGFEDVNNEHVLNFENAALIAQEYEFEAIVDRSESEDLKPRPPPTDVTALPSRPPVVTIMGHVDHGKTTLLDYLRSSSVAASEHGGITQHIGAFSVPMASGQLITFLDTPGHAAFLSMRQRGANVTDIVILVVAADDSVKPQTIEAIKHAKAAKVPIIVAINKVDKDEADIEQVKQDLLVHEIEVEDFGGDIQAIPVSGKTGEGLDKLVEAIVTQAEILDMRAEKDGPAEGWLLEATTKRAGRVATVLVRRGTLRPGDIIVAGTTWARVRTLKNEAGVNVEEAPPGIPVEVDGWRDQATAGDEVLQAPSEQRATSVVEYRESRRDQDQALKDMEAINENRRREAEKHEMEKAAIEEARQRAKDAGERYKNRGKSLTNADYVPKDPSKTELFIIIKADVSGSAEAIEGSLLALPLTNQPVSLNILRLGVGPVSEFDIDQISAVPDGHGFIISFNQQVSNQIAGEAEAAGAKILDENIIYKVIDQVRLEIEAKLPPIISKRVTGDAEVAQVFEINIGGRKSSKVAGCKVRNGAVTKGGKVTVYRGAVGDADAVVYDGTITTLKNQKKDVQDMRKGMECGISFDDWDDFQAGDLLQCYDEKSEPRRLL